MEDCNSGETLSFACDRWMSREEDDLEICRELPVMVDGQPLHPGIDILGGGWRLERAKEELNLHNR